MKKILLILAVVGLYFQQAEAQQIHQLTQYMNNKFAYNPGLAGSSTEFHAKVGFRKQWAGLEDAPTTGILSIEGNVNEDRKIGLGAIIYTDKTGPTARTGAQLAYAYQVPIIPTKDVFLGIGISANLLQHRVNFSELVLQHDTDPQIANSDGSKLGFDSNLGMMLHSEQYWVGFSVNQLLGSKFKLVNDVESIENARHAYIMAGGKFQASETFAIEPNLLAKIVKANSPQFEISAKGIYTSGDNDYWLGVAYRTEDAVAAIVGIDLDLGFNLAYSFDITTSGLNTVSNGTHEITLGFNFSVLGGE